MTSQATKTVLPSLVAASKHYLENHLTFITHCIPKDKARLPSRKHL
jgi:hypothetical protein